MSVKATYTILRQSTHPCLPAVRLVLSTAASQIVSTVVDSIRRRCLLRAHVHKVACLRRRRRPLHRLYYGPHDRSFHPAPRSPRHPKSSKPPVAFERGGGGNYDNYSNRHTVVFGDLRSGNFIVRVADVGRLLLVEVIAADDECVCIERLMNARWRVWVSSPPRRHFNLLHLTNSLRAKVRVNFVESIIYSSLFTITVVEYNIKNTLTNKLN